MPTAAHRRSAFAIFDPAYSAREPYPPAPLLPRWLYLRSEYECFLLERMRRDVEEAKLRIGYPGCFHTPFRVIRYRCRTVRGGFTLRIHGRPEEARLDGRPLTLPEPGGDGCIRIQSGPGLLELRIARAGRFHPRSRRRNRRLGSVGGRHIVFARRSGRRTG